MGAEDVVVAPDGTLYTGTEDGVVWALAPGTHEAREVGRLDGRPLGLELLADGRILVCDAHPGRGLFALDPRDGSCEELATEAEGVALDVCNNAAVAADGTIFFSDSTQDFPLEQWRRDLVTDPHAGRLMRRDPDGTTTVVVRGPPLRQRRRPRPRRVVRVRRAVHRPRRRTPVADRGPRAGEQDVLLPDLPGYPDNIARGSDGLDLGHHRLARRCRCSRPCCGCRRRSAAPSPASRSRCCRTRRAPPASRRTTSPVPPRGWSTTSTWTPRTSTWSPASASTTAGSGSPAWSRRPWPSTTSA